MTYSISTVKPVRRLKRICEGIPERVFSAANRAGFKYQGTPTNHIWNSLGTMSKQNLEAILVHAEVMYAK